jgi:hypothetical protein
VGVETAHTAGSVRSYHLFSVAGQRVLGNKSKAISVSGCGGP